MVSATDRDRQSIRGNVTFDPLAHAIPTSDLTIGEILDCDTGVFIETKAYIGSKRYEELVNERVAVRERLASQPRFRCSLCSVPVYIVANWLKHFFFRHSVEDGSCPAETRGLLSQNEIRALKYNGVRESEPHRRIKELIARIADAYPWHVLTFGYAIRHFGRRVAEEPGQEWQVESKNSCNKAITPRSAA